MAGVEYIDRRKCRRIVPMRVLGLGLGRTGTESLRTALRHLGYNETYHGYAAGLETPLDGEMWYAAANAKFKGIGKPFGRTEWDQLLGHCQAVTDAPAAHFAPELIEAYPEAKVILTTRADPDEWYRSFRPLLSKTYGIPIRIIQVLNELTFSPYRFTPRAFYVMWDHCFPDFDRNWKKQYDEHNELVRELVPKENLLEFRSEDGWGPLCDFLGHEEPDIPYPHGNTGAELKVRFDWYVREQAKILIRKLVAVSAVLGVGWTLWEWSRE